jgi:predicted metalloprotease
MIVHMRRKFFVLMAVGTLVLGACGSTDPGLTADRSNAGGSANTPGTNTPGTEAPSTDSTPPTSSTDTPSTDPSGTDVSIPDTGETTPPPNSVPVNPADAVIDFGVNKTPQPYDAFLQASLADIQDYWRETYPAVYGSKFTELTGGIWASYPNRAEKLPHGCAGDPAEKYISEGNAFYCGNGDYIAYDDYELVPQLTKAFGDSAVGVVFAHEFGHAIQERVGALGPDVPVVYFEQQADCFAGSWTAHVARGESSRLTFGDADVKAGLSAMVAVKDSQLGIDVRQGGAHGTAFDRVGAFENGFKGGAEACKAMETNPLPLLNLQFNSQDEYNNGGNIPYVEILKSVTDDLTRFWKLGVPSFKSPTVTPYSHDGPFPTCDGIDQSAYPFNAVYCPATNSISFDEGYAKTLYNKFGDFSVGYIISNAWSEAVQTQLKSSLSGQQRALIDDCLTGAWTKDTIPPMDGALDPARLYISPGDLDEAVETALLSNAPSNSTAMGSAFEKIDNFRAGVIGGISECNNRISGG